MLIAFIDESGKPSFKEHGPFVLSSLIIDDSLMEKVKGEMAQIKLSKLGPDALDVEIHSRDIVHGIGYYRDLTQQRRLELLDALFEMMLKIDFTIISVVIRNKTPSGPFPMDGDKESWKKFNKGHANRIESWAITLMMERLAPFLSHRSNENLLIAMDEVEWSHDRRLQSYVNDEIIKGVYTSKYSSASRIINRPLFLNSRDYASLQLSDLVAYTIFKNFSSIKKSSIFDFEPYYKAIEPKFDRSTRGKIDGYGLKIT